MYSCLAKCAFKRNFGTYSYLFNQLTKHDAVYDQAGQVFLNTITRGPRLIEDQISEAFTSFIDADYETVKADFLEFITQLETSGYVCTGKSPEMCRSKYKTFTYNIEIPRTAAYIFDTSEKPDTVNDTQVTFDQLFNETPVPYSMQIETTNACNERCVHCYIPHNDKKLFLDKAVIFRVMDEAAALGTLSMTLSGGECMLHPDFIEILRYARKCDFSISVLSNLNRLTEPIIDALKLNDIYLLQTSLYSMKAEEHDSITGIPGSHNATVAAIKKLFSKDIPVQISCPIMKQNFRSYGDVIKFAYDHKMKSNTDFVIMGSYDFNTENTKIRLSADETKVVIEEIMRSDRGYREFLGSKYKPRDREAEKKRPVCGVGRNALCVASNGHYYPCAGWQGYDLGNAYTQTLSDVWHNSDRLKKLRTITRGDFRECMTCNAYDFCAMCMVRNFNESGGDMYKINRHFCDVAFLNKKLVEEYWEKEKISS